MILNDKCTGPGFFRRRSFHLCAGILVLSLVLGFSVYQSTAVQAWASAADELPDAVNYVQVSSAEEVSALLAQEESGPEEALYRIILFCKEADSVLMQKLTDAGCLPAYVVSYEAYDERILTFETAADTRLAYQLLVNEYGADHCFRDQVLEIDELIEESQDGAQTDSQSGTAEGSDTAEDETPASTVYEAASWGVRAMGMDRLKTGYASLHSEQENEQSAVSEEETTLTEDPVTVAVLDTGINRDNAVFAGRTITGWNTKTDSSDYSDFVTSGKGHGTHVCGIIADATPEDVNLLVVGIFDEEGHSSHISVLTAFEYALEHGADVINISAGYKSDSYTFLDTVIDQAYEQGVPVVVAAGNNKSNVGSFYPASNLKTIAVSGLKDSTTSDSTVLENGYDAEFDTSYSNYGSLIDFCAPGTSISSAANAAGTSYTIKNGTSMAAPHITAALAWLKLVYPEDSASQIYERLAGYCVDLGDEGKDILYGSGMPVLNTLLDDAEQTTETETAGQDTGDQNTGADTGDQNTGADTGDQNTGADTGDQNTGADTGDQNTGADTGDQNTGADSGDQNTGADTGDQNTGTDTGDQNTDTDSAGSTACEHVWNNGVTILKATCTSRGKTLYTCTKCGKTRIKRIYRLARVTLYVGVQKSYRLTSLKKASWRILDGKKCASLKNNVLKVNKKGTVKLIDLRSSMKVTVRIRKPSVTSKSQ